MGLALTCLCACVFAAPRPPDGSAQISTIGAVAGPDAPPMAYAAQRGPLTLAQATALAERRYKGRVVRAETVKQGGRTVYEIRILGPDGRVRTVRIDAETGAFL
ncbi:MAG TPA: PepSY domain-containing protein [Gammaproteobacteria bacterium]|nr:PepSY domain-containing protein [Gammaproteobacteria bacterium]